VCANGPATQFSSVPCPLYSTLLPPSSLPLTARSPSANRSSHRCKPYTYVHIHMYIHIHMCVHIYVYVYVYTYTYMAKIFALLVKRELILSQVHIYIYIYIYIFIYIYIYIYICVCVYIYMCVYTHLPHNPLRYPAHYTLPFSLPRLGLYKILFPFNFFFGESIILLSPSPHLQSLHYCNTIALLMCNIRPPPRTPICIPYTI